MMSLPAAKCAMALVIAMTILSGCGRQPSTRGAGEPMAAEFSERPARGATPAGVEERRAELLNRIRAADPQQATIVRALVNENNELGLVLSRQANLDDVPKLLRTMLAELDKAFPGQNHTAIAYAPTNPPQPIGTARLNAKTRDMTYTPAQPR